MSAIQAAHLVALRCRTSDRTPGGGRGTDALAPVLGERLDVEPRLIGSAGDARPRDWSEDLKDAHGCLLEAGGQVDDALADGKLPILLASDCTVCLTTLPTVARYFPAARFLWLDAHGDFNSPDTTGSGFLGGMCLAGACGVWDSGFDGTVDPARVLTAGVRDLDAGEQVNLERAGVGRAQRPGQVVDVLRGDTVFVHLDLDVLDPDEFPAQFPVPGGFSADGVRLLLDEVAAACQIVGLEITAFEAPAEVAAAQLDAHREKLARYEALERADDGTGPRGPWLALQSGIRHEREWIAYWEDLAGR